MMENNEKKRFGRRAGMAAITIILATVAYYICMFRGVDLSWFSEYVKTLLYVTGFVIGGLTITDSVQNWRK
jgi:hypothetical protein